MTKPGSPLRTLRTLLSLGRWLGPWSASHTPDASTRVSHAMGDSRAYVYAPVGRATGVYLVLPGLHFLGPDDPRLDRFCRILAACGFVVVAPFIRSFCRLLLEPSAFSDADDALALSRRIATDRRLGEPAVFSISFGSVLALHLAASAAPPSAAVIFGGYADFLSTVRFAVTGRTEYLGTRHEMDRDPLNSPVVFLNVLEELEVGEGASHLAEAWRAMVHRTWGRMELKAPGKRDPHAHEIAATLPPALRSAFLRGCCLHEGALEWLESGLERAPARLSFMDPVPFARRARCDVILVHGKDDDVIPYVESIKLSREVPRDRLRNLHLTGLYGHTGAQRPTARAVVDEVTTLMKMLADLAGAPGLPPGGAPGSLAR